jgi:hypothetical protein
VLIFEPHDDIRALLELVVRRVGHEPVVHTGDDPGDEVAAAVIEPGEPSGMRLARVLRAREVPVLFTSIYPAGDEARALTPSSYLVKPFPLYALELALKAALAETARVHVAQV